MAQLIHLKQRIKAIETIKKITHAMRLISISTHARLKNKEKALEDYNDTLFTLFNTLKSMVPDWEHALMNPSCTSFPKHLMIIIGSQKGLCGNFNTMLMHFFKHTTASYQEPIDIIVVGKKTLDYFDNHHASSIIKTYSNLSITTLSSLAHELLSDISTAETSYTTVSVISNSFKNFFTHQPRLSRLIPFSPKTINSNESIPDTDLYEWEQQPTELLEVIGHQCLEASLHKHLFESLLAEQAARFISMDSSTRSAESLLETTKLDYNKLRQSKITKELTDLAGNF